MTGRCWCHQFLNRKKRDAPLKLPRLPNARSTSSNLGRFARLPSAATEGLDANIRLLTRFISLTVTFSEGRKKKIDKRDICVIFSKERCKWKEDKIG